MAINRIASLLARTYGPTPELSKHLLASKLGQIRAILAAYPDVMATIAVIEAPLRIMIEVQLAPSVGKSGTLHRLKLKLATDPMLGDVRIVVVKRRADEPTALPKPPGLTRRLRRLFATELKRIRTILAKYPDVVAKIRGIETRYGSRARILIDVQVTHGASKSGTFDRLNLELAADPALKNVRPIVFKQRRHPKR
jgi:hypothetical protein